jgi:hypothetical protein
MRRTIESIMFGFREIFTWNTMKYALITGILVIAIWVGIGWLIWDDLNQVSLKLISFLPVEMMIVDGTWLMSMFLWLIAVLLTFTLIYIFFGNLIVAKIPKNKYGVLFICIMCISAVFWIAIWILNQDLINSKISSFLKSLPYATVEEGLAYLFSVYILYNGLVITMLFVVNIFNKPFISHISQKYYNKELASNYIQRFAYTIKDTLIFMVISLIVFPLLFTPVLNFIIQVALWMWLTKDTIQFNTASLVFGDVNKERLKPYKIDIWIISFVTVLFNFIPILNVFAPFFGEISMFDYWKRVEEEIN